MQFRLEEVNFADGDELATVQGTAQVDNALLRLLHPNLSTEDAIANMKQRWLSVYGFSSWYYNKVVDTQSGKIVGFSRWGMPPELREKLPPVTGIPEGTEVPPRQKPTTLDFEMAGRYGQQNMEIQEKHIGEEISIYLDAWGTLPEYRDQGVEEMMLDWAQKFTDDKGVLLYIEATKELATNYAARGFESVGEIKLPAGDGELVLVALLRKPKSS